MGLELAAGCRDPAATGRTSQLQIGQAGHGYFVEAFLHDECGGLSPLGLPTLRRRRRRGGGVIQFAMLSADAVEPRLVLQRLIGITALNTFADFYA